MATTTLTPKQRQVKTLLEQGKTPTEVAKKLKVNVNSVYQHIRRMKDAEGGAPAKPKRTTARKSTARKSGGKRTARKSTARKRPSRSRPAPAPAAPSVEVRVRPMTPLQAIRNRKSEIEAQITESARRVTVAEKVYKDEKDSHAKLEANRADELKQLTAAEAALTKPHITAAKPRSRSGAKNNGSGSKNAAQAAAAAAAPAATPEPQSAGTPAPAPAQPDPTPVETDGTTGSTTEAPEPVEPPTGDEALAAVGAEQERPGVETLPEFTQEGEDPFAGE